MTKEEIQIILFTLKEGENIRVKVRDRKEELRLRDHVRRSEKYGYSFCLSHLHDGIFYLEKLKEGDSRSYELKIKKDGKG